MFILHLIFSRSMWENVLILKHVLSVMRFTVEKPAVPFLTLWMDTDSTPQYQTQICQLPFTHNPTRSPSKNAGLLVSYTNCQMPHLTTFPANLKQHTNSFSNHIRPPDSTFVKSTPVVLWLSYSPLNPRFAVSNPARVDGFFYSVKILSMTSFGREVTPWVPCRRFTAHKSTSSWN